MAAINQIKLNSTGTTYDINDKRISTTAVNTVDYILGSSSSSLTTISPISSTNLASVLGVKSTDTYIGVAAGETKTITFPSAGFYIVANTGGSAPTTIISINPDNSDIVSMGSTSNLDINIDNGKPLVLIKSTGLNCSLKNNASIQREFFYRKVLF